MNLDLFPKREYTGIATPIEKAARLSALLGGPEIYFKRDDLLGLTGGGNKTRKLEFVIGDALSKGADSLITCGGLQSNHCRLTASAAIKEGLACHLILIRESFQEYDSRAGGNNLIFHLLNVRSFHVIDSDIDEMVEMEKLADDLKARNRMPYIIPMGASYPVGLLGYIACAREIIQQSRTLGFAFDYVVCPSGSGGTQGGLILGFLSQNTPVQVLGMNVSRSMEEQKQKIWDLIEDGQSYFGHDFECPEEKMICFDDYVGEGYAIPTEGMVSAVKMTARTEGILLDPVYTGKAMAGLIDLIRKGFFKRQQKVLFIHTGGGPALYQATDLFI